MSAMFSRSKSGHAYSTGSDPFVVPPSRPAGRVLDVSGRPLLCASSNLRNEVIVGSSDHALYAVDVSRRVSRVTDVKSRSLEEEIKADTEASVTTMYPKSIAQGGHNDWVTTVAHLPNGFAISGGMDGRLCLWSSQDRRTSVSLVPTQPSKPPMEESKSSGREPFSVPDPNSRRQTGRNAVAAAYAQLAAGNDYEDDYNPPSRSGSGSGGYNRAIGVGGPGREAYPISKVLADGRYNTAISLTYGGVIDIWSLESGASGGLPAGSVRGKYGACDGTMSTATCEGHQFGITDGVYIGNRLATGDKGGMLMLWDLSRATALTRFRAHMGAITTISAIDGGSVVLTGGADGWLKLWDPRLSGSGLAMKIAVHCPLSSQDGPGDRAVRGLGGPTSKYSGRGMAANSGHGGGVGAPVSVLAPLYGRGSSDVSQVVTGGGNAHDSRLCMIDLRNAGGYEDNVMASFDVHKNGIYSLCVVNSDVLLSGDGNGMLACHDLTAANSADPNACLRYGLGASREGAVRAIQCVNGSVVAACEDGNVMIYEF